MTGWLRRVLGLQRATPRPPLSLTRRELTATRPTFVRHVSEADKVLANFKEFDGSLRLVLDRKPR